MLSVSMVASVFALGVYFQGWRPIQPDEPRGFTVWFKAATIVYISPGESALFNSGFFLSFGVTVSAIILQIVLKPKRER